MPQASCSESGQTRDHDLPDVGTAYLWDGDHMVAEVPLSLDGHIAWDEATHWHFEEGSHRLLAKQLPSGQMLAIVSDHLGTPKEMFDDKGTLIWAADHHVWGAIKSQRVFGAPALAPEHDPSPDAARCPWRFPGQYEDTETGLYYNRHRHYDPLTGQYASPDPIGLAGGDRPQGYVGNPNTLVDVLGLSRIAPGGGLQAHENAGGHMIERHVGKTDAELASRFTGKRPIKNSSTFTDRPTAERATAIAIDAHEKEIKDFLSGSEKRFVFVQDYHGDVVGRVLSNGQPTAVLTDRARFVLDIDPSMTTGYRFTTGYPELP